MKDHHAVLWPHHGIFGTGSSIDEAFGLIETIEKAAQIYMLIAKHDIQQRITDQELADLVPKPLTLFQKKESSTYKHRLTS